MPAPGIPVDLTGVHVLVVDDDEDARRIMHATLAYCGALVTSVESAKRAYQALTRVKPKVIVCDLAMPEEDGLSFVREIREVPSFSRIPVVAVTAYDHFYGPIREVFFDAYITKPISPPELARVVASLAR
ncbi:MAG TPA: response regulator [Methylomirabilota bacterium]|jgi:CheY-like chemotaxis protein